MILIFGSEDATYLSVCSKGQKSQENKFFMHVDFFYSILIKPDRLSHSQVISTLTIELTLRLDW